MGRCDDCWAGEPSSNQIRGSSCLGPGQSLEPGQARNSIASHHRKVHLDPGERAAAVAATVKAVRGRSRLYIAQVPDSRSRRNPLMITMHPHMPLRLGAYDESASDNANYMLPAWRHPGSSQRERADSSPTHSKASDDWAPHSHVKVSGNHRTSNYLIGRTAEVRSCAKTGGWVTLVRVSCLFQRGFYHASPLQQNSTGQHGAASPQLKAT